MLDMLGYDFGIYPPSFPSLGIAWVEAAEGETVETATITNWTIVYRIYIQVVGASRRTSRIWSAVSIIADIARCIVIGVHRSATDIS